LKDCSAFIYSVKKFKKTLLRLPDPKYIMVLWSFEVSVTIYRSTWCSIKKKKTRSSTTVLWKPQIS